MKAIFALLMISIHAHTFELLDSKKFHTLGREQQVKYLTEVQKIIVGITKKSPYSAEKESTPDRLPASSRPNLDDWSTSGMPTSPPADIYFNSKLNSPEEKPEDITVAKMDAPPKKIMPKRKTRVPDKTSTTEHYRCMHSGFVIEKDPCTGYQKIPDWMGIDGVTEKNKSCSYGYSVCNPILFGLKLPTNCESLLDETCSKEAKPFCAKRGLWPTEECHQMATSNGNRGTWIAAEISSQIKPSLYEKYQQQMKGLCDPEQIKLNPFAEYKNGIKRSDKKAQAVRDDITKTCDWASKQVSLLNETITDQTSGGNFSKPPTTEGQK